jgi:hypothetical protein
VAEIVLVDQTSLDQQLPEDIDVSVKPEDKKSPETAKNKKKTETKKDKTVLEESLPRTPNKNGAGLGGSTIGTESSNSQTIKPAKPSDKISKPSPAK